VGDGTNLYTYDIDSETLQPSLAGTTPYPVPYGAKLATSSDGSFHYFLGSGNGSIGENHIYVYNTNANGVPGKVLQTVDAASDWPIVVGLVFLKSQQQHHLDFRFQRGGRRRYTGRNGVGINDSELACSWKKINGCEKGLGASDIRRS
jgi:hypothetical protein